MKKKLSKPKTNRWRYIVNFWTLFVLAFILLDFFTNNRFVEGMAPLLAVYTGILAIYSTEKEFERWHHFYSGKHPGEVYVLLWTAILGLIFIVDFIFQSPYKMPPELPTTYIVVVGILAITKKSKSLYVSKRRRESNLKLKKPRK